MPDENGHGVPGALVEFWQAFDGPLGTKWRREAQIPPWIDGREKTVSDTRGTAATRLLNADLSLRQIAVLKRLSVRHAAQVITHYA